MSLFSLHLRYEHIGASVCVYDYCLFRISELTKTFELNNWRLVKMKIKTSQLS